MIALGPTLLQTRVHHRRFNWVFCHDLISDYNVSAEQQFPFRTFSRERDWPSSSRVNNDVETAVLVTAALCERE